MHLLSSLGFVLNLEKSQLRPTQNITFIGAVLGAVQGKAFLPQERVSSIRDCIAVFNAQRSAPARLFLCLMGRMASSVAVTPWARLRIIPIQRHLHQRWSQLRGSLLDPVQITDSLRTSLVSWQDAHYLCAGVAFVPEEPTLILTTDASQQGWGAFLGSEVVQGLWCEEESRLHINLLELRAVHFALAHLLHKVRGSVVLLRTDNTTVVCYVNRQGGHQVTCALLGGGALMGLGPDAPSRSVSIALGGQRQCPGGHLEQGSLQSPQIVFEPENLGRHLCMLGGVLDVDLLVSAANAVVPRFWSRWNEPEASDLDTLSNRWPAGLLYVFPPIPLIPRVIWKFRNEGRRMILIAPHWPRQVWFPFLLSLQQEPALPLPLWDDVVSQNEGKVLHPNPRSLNLHAWFLRSET
ncbi:mitochondrial import receptor subunit TOM5 homolog isoform X3 [Latimeria chalumnae]|uniref:mitochondrial import receptor subunit TOM5 homolog isoform X3 n=1 Tax=Latimeria chalumnae TaxID=7897 RepID=UPI00313B270F